MLLRSLPLRGVLPLRLMQLLTEAEAYRESIAHGCQASSSAIVKMLFFCSEE